MSRPASTDWQVVRLDAVVPTLWKNGGGLTRELLVWPQVAGGIGQTNWSARISIAEITQDGPFSRFENVQRWFAVLQGAGLTLEVDGLATTLTTTSEPMTFDGNAQTHCRLIDGPTQDFNLMLRGSDGSLQRYDGRHRVAWNAPALVAAYCQTQGASLVANGRTIELPPQSLCWRSVQPQYTSGETSSVELNGNNLLWLEVRL